MILCACTLCKCSLDVAHQGDVCILCINDDHRMTSSEISAFVLEGVKPAYMVAQDQRQRQRELDMQKLVLGNPCYCWRHGRVAIVEDPNFHYYCTKVMIKSYGAKEKCLMYAQSLDTIHELEKNMDGDKPEFDDNPRASFGTICKKCGRKVNRKYAHALGHGATPWERCNLGHSRFFAKYYEGYDWLVDKLEEDLAKPYKPVPFFRAWWRKLFG